ncbi:hypothetical protein [Okeania sp. KiyG1]|uniref:hypothetical protein n=1 Tax=Okeania sp. KiyG1 TaxID=2720165 RepID=UPI0019219C57|nr:hypothetical protein [Okeania sp. KiyG1]GGA03616.1 hypothetical protein CYANOKiyG1_15760 [Okeania sp. KiyG1]
MKKLLTAIAGLSVLAAGILGAAPAQALPIFGEDNDLADLFNGEVTLSEEQFNVTNEIAGKLNVSTFELLQDPDKVDDLYAGDAYDSNTAPSGLGVYSKNGCTVDAGCAIKAIGMVNTLKCAGSGTDPQNWAECVQNNDYDAYLAASACTYGSCPAFATLPNQKVVACNNGLKSVIAGKSYINLPSTLAPQKNELQISWLSQG